MDEPAPSGSDSPTNVYFIAQYQYQMSVNAVPMADNELGVFLPRSGRLWFNARLFSDVPSGLELATRDVWWRVIDASPAVRFLLGWSLSLCRSDRFHQGAAGMLPDSMHVLHFNPSVPDSSPSLVSLWSDVICDVTNLFAPSARLQRHLQGAAPVFANQSHPGAQGMASGRDVGLLLRFLADRNNCPATIIRRSLTGNAPIYTLEDYLEFTEDVLRDIPRLQMQRTIAMQHAKQTEQRASVWKLHL